MNISSSQNYQVNKSPLLQKNVSFCAKVRHYAPTQQDIEDIKVINEKRLESEKIYPQKLFITLTQYDSLHEGNPEV